ncbi:MAG: hypothetical protein K2X78_03325 [Burkholderiaceae bacterium]|nr:hypothetical protein [Burkholderiaceae bacterium]
MADVKRWTVETALKAAEQWLMVCGTGGTGGKAAGSCTGAQYWAGGH